MLYQLSLICQQSLIVNRIFTVESGLACNERITYGILKTMTLSNLLTQEFFCFLNVKCFLEQRQFRQFQRKEGLTSQEPRSRSNPQKPQVDKGYAELSGVFRSLSDIYNGGFSVKMVNDFRLSAVNYFHNKSP